MEAERNNFMRKLFGLFDNGVWQLWYVKTPHGYAYMAEKGTQSYFATRYGDGHLAWDRQGLPAYLKELAARISLNRVRKDYVGHSDLVKTFGGKE